MINTSKMVKQNRISDTKPSQTVWKMTNKPFQTVELLCLCSCPLLPSQLHTVLTAHSRSKDIWTWNQTTQMTTDCPSPDHHNHPIPPPPPSSPSPSPSPSSVTQTTKSIFKLPLRPHPWLRSISTSLSESSSSSPSGFSFFFLCMLPRFVNAVEHHIRLEYPESLGSRDNNNVSCFKVKIREMFFLFLLGSNAATPTIILHHNGIIPVVESMRAREPGLQALSKLAGSKTKYPHFLVNWMFLKVKILRSNTLYRLQELQSSWF